MRTVSLATMLEQIEGLLGTNDLTPWESGFVENVTDRYRAAGTTTVLSSRQAETVESIWRKHFA